jgi:hypothetical protein
MATSADRVRRWREKEKRRKLEMQQALDQLRIENAELRERERHGQRKTIGWDASDPTTLRLTKAETSDPPAANSVVLIVLYI